MEELKKEIAHEIHLLTVETINNLMPKWINVFDSEIAENNLRTLVTHVKMFYDEIINETDTRKAKIVEKTDRLWAEYTKLKEIFKPDDVDDSSLSAPIPLLNYQNELSLKIKILHEKIEEFQQEIDQLISVQHCLCTELGLPERTLLYDELFPSEVQLSEFKCHVNELIAEKETRQQIITNLRESIFALSEELEIPVTSDRNLLSNPKISLKTENINRLKHIRSNLINKKQFLKVTIERLKVKLVTLWDCLEIDDQEREIFPIEARCSQTTLDAIEAEIKRYETIKMENIQRCVERIRSDIQIYWDKTYKCEKARAKFPYINNDCYTEDLLNLHELELNDLKEFYEENAELYAKYEEHKHLWERFMALEAKENDPQRLTNRGGQLLIEERERKRINIKLPKLRAEITELSNKYEGIHERKFLIWGRSIDEEIAIDYSNWQQQKKDQLSARKAGKEPTPLGHNNFKTPSSAARIQAAISPVKQIESTGNLPKPRNVSVTKKSKLKINSSAKRNLLDAYMKPCNNKISGSKTPMKRVICTLTETGQQRRMSHRRSVHRRRVSGFNSSAASRARLQTSSNLSYDQFEGQISQTNQCRSTLAQQIEPMRLRAITPSPLLASPGQRKCKNT